VGRERAGGENSVEKGEELAKGSGGADGGGEEGLPEGEFGGEVAKVGVLGVGERSYEKVTFARAGAGGGV
jgi:hypothetical protein